MKDFVLVKSLQPLVASGLLETGAAAVQDESAGLVGLMVEPKAGDYLIDGCAAPGGKSIRVALLMRDEGRVVAIDPNAERLELARQACGRHGLTSVEFLDGSFLDLDLPSGEQPDRILLDVPCSGLGVLARRPDLRWNRGPDVIPELVHLQDLLLDKAAGLLKIGGQLTYATCTIEPEENEDRITAFLERHGEFEPAPPGREVTSEVVDSNGWLATLPQIHQIDGAFAANLRKVK
jgi:16S rRNA (cytosine967-C5)-methyltransferase